MRSPKPSSFKRARAADPATAVREVAAAARRAKPELRALAADPLASILPFSLRVAHIWAVAILSAVALAVFLNSLGNRFVTDDRLMIEQNPVIRDLAILNSCLTAPTGLESTWMACIGLFSLSPMPSTSP